MTSSIAKHVQVSGNVRFLVRPKLGAYSLKYSLYARIFFAASLPMRIAVDITSFKFCTHIVSRPVVGIQICLRRKFHRRPRMYSRLAYLTAA